MIIELEMTGKKECLIVIVCYMTVEGEHAREENENKLQQLFEKMDGKF